MRVLYDKHSRSQQPESKRVISALLAICSVREEHAAVSGERVRGNDVLTSVVDDTTFSSNASGESAVHSGEGERQTVQRC